MNIKELRGKRLLVLGGSTWKEAIKAFKEEYDIKIIAAGLWKVGVYDIADECYTIDILNQDVMTSFIKEKNIDGVYMGGAENVIYSACQYIKSSGLPCYCTKEQWEYLQNKANFKSLCESSGLPVVPQYIIDANNIIASVPQDAFPVITKPSDGCGSNGFSVCKNSEELVEGYKKAAADSPTQSVICEKFVKNEGVVVFYTFSKGEVIFSGLEDKSPVRFEKQGSYVGGLFTFPSKLTSEFRSRFDAGVERMFKTIGVNEGSAWIEVFHDGDNFYFNEVGFRYGGSISIYPVDYFTGINQVAADIYYALTGESQPYGHKSLVDSNIKRGLNYAVYPVYAGEGVISSIEGLDKLGDNIVFSTITKPIGCKIEDCGSFNQNVAIVQFVYKNEAELKSTIERIHDNLQVIDEMGNNMIIRMLTFNV